MIRLLFLIALVVALAAPCAATTYDVKANFGAAGNGTTNDTAAVRSALAALQPGDTLNFPCGTYLVNAALTLNRSNVTLAGTNGCTTIKGTGSGYIVLR